MRRWGVCVCVSVCEGDCSEGIWRPRSLPISFFFQSALHVLEEKEAAEVKENLRKPLISILGCSQALGVLSKSALTWERGETFEGLVRGTCPAASSTCFTLGISQRHTR